MGTNMRDVAKLAQVSQRTVSNVVNGYAHVRPETRQRVQDAIATLNYRPNVSAQKLRRGRSGVVALAVPEIAAPYFAELANEVQRSAAQRGITLLIDQTGGLRDRELLVLDGYRSNVIDGLILSPLSITPFDLVNRGLDFPTVLLGESIDEAGVIHVSIDNVAAATTATEHLLQAGRRHIATVGYMPQYDTRGPAERRLRGFSQAMAAAQIPVDAHLTFAAPTWTRATGYAAAALMLEADLKVDAAFCFNDTLAMGLIKGLQDAGVGVPDDIAVIGWDDTEECSFSTPTLTSIAPDKGQIARLAVDHLLAAISGASPDDMELLVDYHLAARESTGAHAKRTGHPANPRFEGYYPREHAPA